MPVSTTAGSLRPVDALFTSASAVCVTGLIVVDTGSYFSIPGQGVILVLIQLGGLGIMTYTSLVLLLWLQTRDAPHHRGRWLAAASASGLLFATQRYDAYLMGLWEESEPE